VASSGSTGPSGPAAASAPAPAHGASASSLGGPAGPKPFYAFKLKGNEIGPGHSAEAVVDLNLDRAGACSLTLYGEAGQTFLDLARADRPAGPWSVAWTGQGPDGTPAPSGVYTLVIQVPGHFEKTHIVVVH
jgi:hypothetical protein